MSLKDISQVAMIQLPLQFKTPENQPILGYF